MGRHDRVPKTWAGAVVKKAREPRFENELEKAGRMRRNVDY